MVRQAPPAFRYRLYACTVLEARGTAHLHQIAADNHMAGSTLHTKHATRLATLVRTTTMKSPRRVQDPSFVIEHVVPREAVSRNVQPYDAGLDVAPRSGHYTECNRKIECEEVKMRPLDSSSYRKTYRSMRIVLLGSQKERTWVEECCQVVMEAVEGQTQMSTTQSLAARGAPPAELGRSSASRPRIPSRGQPLPW